MVAVCALLRDHLVRFERHVTEMQVVVEAAETNCEVVVEDGGNPTGVELLLSPIGGCYKAKS